MKHFAFFWLLVFSLAAPTSANVSLRGSRGAMASENRTADTRDLSRIENDSQLRRMIQGGYLVPLRQTRCLRIDPRLRAKFRYVRPWTRTFLTQLSNRFCREVGGYLQVNSAVRTVAYQQQLIRTNPNAARGGRRDTRTTHTTGATVDIAKKNLTRRQIRWLQKRLKLNEEVERAHVTEERRQAVFHIMVRR